MTSAMTSKMTRTKKSKYTYRHVYHESYNDIMAWGESMQKAGFIRLERHSSLKFALCLDAYIKYHKR